MIKRLFLLAALAGVWSVSAQNGTLHLRLVDRVTREPVVGAVAELRSQADTAQTPFYAASDIDGAALLQRVPAGAWRLRVTSLGYEALERELRTSGGKTDLGTLEMSPGAEAIESVVCLTMGTGIGGGIVVHDRMLRGRRLSAAELGQTSIHYQGKTGPFGSRGAIEEYIGNNELAAEAVKRYAGAGIIKTVDECTPRHLDEAARSGCPIALQLWEDTAEMLGCLIMNLMYTLVPDAFIIGGGVAKAGDLLMKPLLENLRKQLFPLLMEDLKILPARFGAEAGLLGAGAMAMDEFMGMGILERFKNQKSTQTFC